MRDASDASGTRVAYRRAMVMSALAMTISMFWIRVRKKGQSRAMTRNSSRSAAPAAEPKPNQPGSMTRDCDQLKTQGMARRSAIDCDALREAGRLPMLSAAISLITVDSQK